MSSFASDPVKSDPPVDPVKSDPPADSLPSIDDAASAVAATVIEEATDTKVFNGPQSSAAHITFIYMLRCIYRQAVSGVVDQFKLLATSEKNESDRVRAVQSQDGHLRAAATFEDPELNL